MILTAILSFCAGALAMALMTFILRTSTNINMLGSNFRIKAKDGTEIVEISVTGTGRITVMYLWGKFKGKAQLFDYPKQVEQYYKSHKQVINLELGGVEKRDDQDGSHIVEDRKCQ